MNWKSEEGQKILAVAHSLQTNNSNAASTPKWRMQQLIKEWVYGRYCYEKGKYEYSFQPFEDKQVDEVVESVRIVSKGRNAISGEKIAEIKRMGLEGHSLRFIAKELKVGRGTVEKYLKSDS